LEEQMKCNDCAGLRMKVGKLEKKLREAGRIDLPDLRPYLGKVDTLKNLIDNNDVDGFKKKLYAELNNLKTIFEKLIADVAVKREEEE
jgi:hypothetical protein